MLKELIHNGVVVPEPPEPRGLKLRIRGQWHTLTLKQEEMVMAWARKHGTPYVEDPVFVSNFMADFSAELGIQPPLVLDEVDFGPAIRIVEAEKAARDRLTPEERKALAAERKAAREELRNTYGVATVNGSPVDLANYVVEPSGIFMGRGQHPLRGRWKEGATHEDITLNLSPDAPRPQGNWAEIVWQPESLWVARWKDKLSDKLKYVWLSDTSPLKQRREVAKFDQAYELANNMDQVRAHIQAALTHDDPRRRRIATACFLIDVLCLRVGDEKEEDEADTVGATTLRPEHVTLHDDCTAEFRFLGKDSVLWHKKVDLPPVVIKNLQELVENACPSSGNCAAGDKPQLFPDISSRDVNAFLSEVMPDISAKVFRTHHATEVVATSLAESKVKASDPEYKKWKATRLANLEAALLCNHYKKESSSWPRSKQRYEERQAKAEERVEGYKDQIQELQAKVEEVIALGQERIASAKSDQVRKKRAALYGQRTDKARERVATARERLKRAQDALGKIKAQKLVASRSRTWNLGTSLKSYVDPRVLTHWGHQVEYDVLEKYYPKALRLKFSWADPDKLAEQENGQVLADYISDDEEYEELWELDLEDDEEQEEGLDDSELDLADQDQEEDLDDEG